MNKIEYKTLYVSAGYPYNECHNIWIVRNHVLSPLKDDIEPNDGSILFRGKNGLIGLIYLDPNLPKKKRETLEYKFKFPNGSLQLSITRLSTRIGEKVVDAIFDLIGQDSTRTMSECRDPDGFISLRWRDFRNPDPDFDWLLNNRVGIRAEYERDLINHEDVEIYCDRLSSKDDLLLNIPASICIMYDRPSIYRDSLRGDIHPDYWGNIQMELMMHHDFVDMVHHFRELGISETIIRYMTNLIMHWLYCPSSVREDE